VSSGVALERGLPAGGISNGEDIVIRLAFKPTSTITVGRSLAFFLFFVFPSLKTRALKAYYSSLGRLPGVAT